MFITKAHQKKAILTSQFFSTIINNGHPLASLHESAGCTGDIQFISKDFLSQVEYVDVHLKLLWVSITNL